MAKFTKDDVDRLQKFGSPGEKFPMVFKGQGLPDGVVDSTHEATLYDEKAKQHVKIKREKGSKLFLVPLGLLDSARIAGFVPAD